MSHNEKYIQALKKMRKRQNSGTFGGAEPNCSDEGSGSETEKDNDDSFYQHQHKIFFTEGGRTNKVSYQ